ncbi:MAG: aldo/keto reductase [Planctomycetota bacterium]|nr:MAG: aldo/keto reductase [Planctomycetota bacterium]
MKKKQNKMDRRDFLKTIGAVGVGSVLPSCDAKAEPNDPNAVAKMPGPALPQVPKRKLGRTSIEVPCLSLGLMYDLIEKQIILRKSVELGISFWDTAPAYAGGNSELGIGKFLAKNPEVRKDVFLATKASGARTVNDVEKCLQASLKRLNTSYIDLYHGVHALTDPEQLTDELKQWVKDAKKRKLIRSFGFSMHTNIAENLAAVAKLDWIDAIMTSYNFRLMQDAKIPEAIDACYNKGIGLIAMKTTGKTIVSWARQDIETKEDKKLIDHFLQRGFGEEQATIKLVLDDKRISSACVGMENVAILSSNQAAVLDKTELTKEHFEVFREYAKATCSGYCAGCANICNPVLPDMPYVSDIMRYLMYYNTYGDKDRARGLFARIPREVRNKLLRTDYSVAEARCPQQLPIGKLIAEAISKLA